MIPSPMYRIDYSKPAPPPLRGKNDPTHEDIERQTKEFLARGGEIKHIDPTLRAYDKLADQTQEQRRRGGRAAFNSVPVVVVNTETGDVRRFESGHKAANFTGIAAPTVSDYCRSGKTIKGFRFYRLDAYEKAIKR